MNPLLSADPVTIGDFALLARLGAGGMGQLYLGRRPDGSAAAIKLIRPDLAHQPDFRARFRREIAAAGQADGPYTARVIAADPDGDPPWLAVEYVPGPSVAEVVGQHGMLPKGCALALMAGLCAGLIRLHELGLVHRDLKPGNVLITTDGPRIIDFGVSRALDSSTITQTGQLLGSPGFMSPEQALGTGPVGPPSDVFALGALIVYVLTGTSPFGTGHTPAIVYRVVHEPPSVHDVPYDLRRLITDCLAKNPADRPTAREVLNRLTPAGAPVAGLMVEGWLPEPVESDIRRRVAELAARRNPDRADSGETMLRPRPAATPAPAVLAHASTRHRGRTPALVGAAVAIMLAATVGTTMAVRRHDKAGPVTAQPTAAADVASLPASDTPSVPAPSSAAVASSVATWPSASPAAASTRVSGSSGVVVQRPAGTGRPPAARSTPRTEARTTPKYTPKAGRASAPEAAPQKKADGPACFGTAIRGGFELKNGITVAGGPNYTSSKCRDIHITLTSALTWTYARSCLETPDGSSITSCSGWVFLSYPDTWDTLSKSVPPRTRWQLQMYALGDESARFSYSA